MLALRFARHASGYEGPTMIADHDAYIAEAPEALRPLLVRLRAVLAEALPDAEEVIAYKMPGVPDRGDDRRGLCGFQQAMRALCAAFRHRRARRRDRRGRAQGDEDGGDVLAGQADA